jgi:hypothetical protein
MTGLGQGVAVLGFPRHFRNYPLNADIRLRCVLVTLMTRALRDFRVIRRPLSRMPLPLHIPACRHGGG